MIPGFEEITEKLNEKELEMADLMAPGFRLRKGKVSAITAKEITIAMKKKGYVICGRRIRKIVNYLVVTDKVKDLVANSNGYYVAVTDDERKEHAFSLGHRMAAIMARLQKSPYAGEVIYNIKQLKCLE